jgi:hypothetical protein
MRVLVHQLNPSAKSVPAAAGATLGQDHIRPLRERIHSSDEEVVVLDFSGIESATASYLKATIIWLIQCGRSSTRIRRNSAPYGAHDPIPLAIYPAVIGLTNDVREELDAVLPGYRLPCLEVLRLSRGKILRAALHGPLDEALSDTLSALTQSGSGTASSLCELYPDRKIMTTGWNNRLADLHELRLATRKKEGRQWVYKPVAVEVRNGRES